MKVTKSQPFTMKWLGEWKQMLEANNETFPQIGGIYSKSSLYLSLCSNVHNILVCITSKTCAFSSACFVRVNCSIISFDSRFLFCLSFSFSLSRYVVFFTFLTLAIDIRFDRKQIKTFLFFCLSFSYLI